MLYYRGTRRNNPMSDWGHAMFTADYNRAYMHNIGDYGWVLDSKDCVRFCDIRDMIIQAWTEDIEQGYFTGDFGNNPANDWYLTADIAAEEIADSFNPVDIVDSADAWDSDLTQWFWERIAEPNDIMAISTRDGAICFDASLINPYSSAA